MKAFIKNLLIIVVTLTASFFSINKVSAAITISSQLQESVSICENSASPTQLNVTVQGFSTSSRNLTITWYTTTTSTTSGGTQVSTETVTPTSGSNYSFSYTPVFVAGTYYYYARIKDNTANATVTTRSCTYTVGIPTVTGSISGNLDVCSSGSTTLTLSGSSGSIRWEVYNGSSWGAASTSSPASSTNTSSTYTTSLISTTTQFRARLRSTGCTTQYTDAVTVTPKNAPNSGTISGDGLVCVGSDKTLTVTSAVSPFKWQSSNDNSLFTDVSGQTSSNLQLTNIQASKYYRVVSTCTTTSNSATVAFIDVRQNGEWIGLHPSDNNWNNTTNWCGGLPTMSTDVVLYAGNPMTFPDVTTENDALCRNLTIMSGSKILFSSTGAGRLRIYGDLTNNSGSDAIYPTNGSVSFEGTNQSIGGSNATFFNNVNINGGGSKSLSKDVTVNGAATFSSGYLATANSSKLIFSAGSSVSGAKDASFAKLVVIKYGSTDFEFPVGGLINATNKYRPIAVSGITNYVSGDYYSAEHIAENALTSSNFTYNGTYYVGEGSNTLQSLSTFEYWNLNRSAGSTAKANVTIDWTIYPTTDANAPKLRLAHFNSGVSKWENPQNAGSLSYVLLTKKLTVAAVSEYSPFTMASITASALPVTLTNFSAKAGLNNTVNLAWATSTEIVNKGFRIERQSAIGNGKFENVGFVASKAAEGGNSNVPLYYSFVDVAPASNATNYYRLAQVDLDGKTTYSDVKLVRIGGETVTMVYPNPSNGAVNISRTANNNKMNIQILDMSGRMVQQYSNVTDANFKLNINKAGMYNIKMIYPQTGEQTIQRIVVQK